MAINQIQTLTFKSQANSDPCNANICTLLEVHVFSNSLMIHCKGRVCLFSFRNRYWSWHPKGIFSWKQSYSPLSMSFFLDRSLGLKYYTDSRCLWRFSACMQEQKGQCPMFPQHINCCSCGDLPFYSTFLNPYFLSRNYCRYVQDSRRCINLLPSVSTEHSLCTSQKNIIWLFIIFI